MDFQAVFNEQASPRLDEVFGTWATLAHGDVITERFKTRWENRTFTAVDAEGNVTVVHMREFTCDKAQVKFLDAFIEPRVGDRLTLTENDRESVFEVQPAGTLPACESMPGGYRWLVRTKQVR